MSDIKKIILNTPDKTLICDSHKPMFTALNDAETEQQLEEALIETLSKQGYEYIELKNEQDLKANLKIQLTKLKRLKEPNFQFSRSEWDRFYADNFEGPTNEGIENRNKKIQGNQSIRELHRDDGTVTNIPLIEKDNPAFNYLQIINQYVDRERKSRYDVTILVNGLPLVHIELKKRGIALKTAFNQISKYQKYSFHGLFEFIQIFVISNGADTRYYSNTTRLLGNTKNSFLFTSRWADKENRIYKTLHDFSLTFLNRINLLEILTQYCVLKTENKEDSHAKVSSLKILRPYQIWAIKEIIENIKKAASNQITSKDSCGYIWHTTGSGKTLTSFKAAQLATKIKGVEKVLFVVDRKDLDSQTSQEYRAFLGEGLEQTIDSTENTDKLIELLLNDRTDQIIITTIQKLKRAFLEPEIKKNEKLRDKRVVIIMDECHRSQRAETHDTINRYFKKRSVFGFTGTPLYKVYKSLNADERLEAGPENNYTEKQVVNFSDLRFGKCLHKYLIINAIQDENVVKFWLYEVGDKTKNHLFQNVDEPNRVPTIVKYIIRNFAIKTNPRIANDFETLNKRQTRFNSILAVSSVDEAIKYYKEFKKQLQENPPKNHDLKVAMIFSPKLDQDYIDDEDKEAQNKVTNKIDYEKELSEATKDFSDMFQITNKKLSPDEYRNQVSKKVKDREIDLLIVVQMFLTGFDAPRLNTLWVDKYLDKHNLIQAFSRTNRIYDETKKFGNIVLFRDLKEEVDFAIGLFAGDAKTVILDSFDKRMPEYLEIEQELLEEYPPERELVTEEEKLDFVDKYKKFANLANGLSCDERFYEQRKMTENQGRDYKARYLEIYDEFKNKPAVESKEVQNIAFDLELLRSEEITIDYIYELLRRFHGDPHQEELEETINEVLLETVEFRPESSIIKKWIEARKEEQTQLVYSEYKKLLLFQELEELCAKENYNFPGVKKTIEKFLEKEDIYFGGSSIKRDVMPPINLTKDTAVAISKWNFFKEYVTKIFEKFNFFVNKEKEW